MTQDRNPKFTSSAEFDTWWQNQDTDRPVMQRAALRIAFMAGMQAQKRMEDETSD